MFKITKRHFLWEFVFIVKNKRILVEIEFNYFVMNINKYVYVYYCIVLFYLKNILILFSN